MDKKIIFLTSLILAIIFLSAYQSMIESNSTDENLSIRETKITLAGISLGDTIDDVEAELGKDYIIERIDDSGWWGEPVAHLFYDNDMEIVIGDESGQVLQINLNTNRYTTTKGDKVGDRAEEVLPYYQEKYPLAKDHFEGNELPGWFVVDEGVWLIFNFKDDDTMINYTIDPTEEVYAIHMVYERFVH